MKKNVMMRLAAILLVCVLASTCGISGTYAKYVTTGHSEDSARVAKWGVTINATTNSMFGAAYTSADGTVSASYEATTDSVHAANGTDYVVAPGTEGQITTITITGKPEVDVKIDFVGTVTLTGWMIDDGFYCPLIFVIKDKSGTEIAKIDGTTYNDAETLQNAIATFINNFSHDYYEANTELANENECTFNLSWEWPYHTSNANDVKDTKLGNLDTAPRISITIDVTATQVD